MNACVSAPAARPRLSRRASHAFARIRLADSPARFRTVRCLDDPLMVQGSEATAAGGFAGVLRITRSPAVP